MLTITNTIPSMTDLKLTEDCGFPDVKLIHSVHTKVVARCCCRGYFNVSEQKKHRSGNDINILLTPNQFPQYRACWLTETHQSFTDHINYPCAFPVMMNPDKMTAVKKLITTK